MRYNQLTTETFNKKSKQLYGNKVDRNNVNYINNRTPVLFKCNINNDHGEFWQRPDNHLSGRGCPKCGRDRISEFKKNSEEDIVNRFKETHGDKYIYDNFVYNGFHTNSIMKCKEHGDFLQSPANHIKGHGCPNCGLLKTLEYTRLSLEDFIIKAIEIHGGKYNYQDFIYSSTHIKGSIKCNICGYIFEQTPGAHLQGQGCPRCKKSKGELRIIEILDKYDIDFKDEYKLPEIGDNYRYDFYLPDYNVLIEFHGKQHYKHIQFFHKTEDEFLARKNIDDIKKYSARKWKYKLIEFNYKQLKHMPKKKFEELVLTTINSLI
jgi:hypothetical protein